MYYTKRAIILAALGAMLMGTALHFFYGWVPNLLTALISPVNESLWEHVKIIFWPYLLFALLLNLGRPGAMRPWLLTVLFMCIMMLVLGYGYHVLAGGQALWVDILIFVLTMVVGFWLPLRFPGPYTAKKWIIPVVGVVILVLLLGAFTLWPPQALLFADLSSANAWFPLPC